MEWLTPELGALVGVVATIAVGGVVSIRVARVEKVGDTRDALIDDLMHDRDALRAERDDARDRAGDLFDRVVDVELELSNMLEDRRRIALHAEHDAVIAAAIETVRRALEPGDDVVDALEVRDDGTVEL